ncbi:protein halfway isoform X2 [Hetaerina americana]|uniref:protein halfway isoform X2 n=1 Tax=Hetaerina americana TaxID=62018 RepID=UPI003A7F3D9D
MALSMPCIRFDLFCLLLYAHHVSSMLVTSPAPMVAPHPRECISIPGDSCPLPGDPCPCTLAPGDLPSTVPHVPILCCHLVDATQLWMGVKCAMSGNAVATTAAGGTVALHIRNSTLQGLARALDELSPLPMLSSLAMTHTVVPLDDMRRGPLATLASTVACLNLSRNGMGDLPAKALTGLGQLQALDLSHNNITHLPDLPPRVPGDKSLWVDVSGNERLLCSGIKEAMSWNASASIGALSPPTVLSNESSAPHDGVGRGVAAFPPPVDRGEAQPAVLFHNKERTYCITLMKDLWFRWAERIPLDKIEHIIKLECPSGQGYMCVCSLNRFEQSDFSVAVDCSGRGLTELPNVLPKHTTSLNVTNNKITSLERLARNGYYSKIRDFFADNNEITSIEVLEGSDFLDNFQHLFLSGNKLTNEIEMVRGITYLLPTLRVRVQIPVMLNIL